MNEYVVQEAWNILVIYTIFVCKVGKVFTIRGVLAFLKNEQTQKNSFFFDFTGVQFSVVCILTIPLPYKIDEIFSTTRPEVTMQ